MIHTIKINIPTVKEITDLWYPIRTFMVSKLLKLDTWAFKTFGTGFWKLMYRITGRCGSILLGHTPVFNNRKSWLWIESPMGYICTICHELVEVKVGRGSYKNYSRAGREADVAELRRLMTTATSDEERKVIDKSIYNISHEDPHVKSMREELIKATREQDHTKIKEIHEYVGEKRKYRQVDL